CGTQHARMAFYVVALPEEEFEQWVATRHAARAEPAGEELSHGQQVFVASGCGACHGITGLSEATEAGPDLTHLGSRLTLGAGTIANTQENLGAFIRDPHTFKPGLLMPATPIQLDDLDALVAYLMSLE
ncbi:MAG: c-type cytochrome, partial [Phycisphaeraceae bacterium]